MKEGMGCRRSWIVVGNCEALCRTAMGKDRQKGAMVGKARHQ